jgi:peptidoglycan-associated lipoprotein
MVLRQRTLNDKEWRRCHGRVLLAVLLVATMAGFMGCAEKHVAVSGTPTPGATGGGTQGGPAVSEKQVKEQALMDKLGLKSEAERQQFLQQVEQFQNDDIFFDFDSYLLTDDAKRILDRKALFLRNYPAVQVSIEGNCDERGTSEYNLALGERRAKSAWQYLVNSGVDPKLLDVVSYGEERPVALGHDEASWARNRRDHFELLY